MLSFLVAELSHATLSVSTKRATEVFGYKGVSIWREALLSKWVSCGAEIEQSLVSGLFLDGVSPPSSVFTHAFARRTHKAIGVSISFSSAFKMKVGRAA